jgi:hypothetical protein
MVTYDNIRNDKVERKKTILHFNVIQKSFKCKPVFVAGVFVKAPCFCPTSS